MIVTKLLTNTEPRVWYTCDRDGTIWWHADDPATGRSIRHLSEAEMLTWIEQRHYRYEG